jgi:hypothetical protein
MSERDIERHLTDVSALYVNSANEILSERATISSLVVSGIARLPVWRVRARKNVPANADKHSTAQHSTALSR